MRGRIFYFGLVFLDKILAKESRVSHQLSGCGRRTPPTVMLSACGSHSIGPGPSLRSPWGGEGNHSSQHLQSRVHTPPAAREGLYLWSGALFSPLGQAWLSMAALTDGFTALVSINESHDGAQGHVWVILDAL